MIIVKLDQNLTVAVEVECSSDPVRGVHQAKKATPGDF